MPDSRTFEHMPTQARQQYADVLLNRYRMMGDSREGGFGTVLTCWDTRLQRRVAIKRMPLRTSGAAPGTSSTIAEALGEARASSTLQHANIVTVFDFEVDDTYAYLVMEYVDGMSLGELLVRVQGGVLTHDETAHLVKSVASALAFAHERGVLHLDIKPTNIMIDRAGDVKLCDFGMASLASATGYGGARGGTVGYMPPEQIEGGLVDQRADVFALSVVAWQSMLGFNPFAAATAEESLALIQRGPSRPSALDPALADEAEQALLGAMEPSPSARIPSVTILSHALEQALGDPEAGKASLRSLVSQDSSDRDDDLEDWEGERLPLGISYPWLPGVFTRLITAVTAFVLALPLVPVFIGQDNTTVLCAAGGCALAAALWPPLASAVVMIGLCAALAVSSSSAPPVLLAIVVALLFILWWASCAIKSPLSSLSLLLPACMGSSLAGVAVAGTALQPPAAMATAGASWFVGRIWPAATAAQFTLDGLVNELLAPIATPRSLLSLAGCMVAAALCSSITWRRDRAGFAIAGQLVGCTLLVASQLLAERMENGGIWPEPSWENAGVAVLLSVLVCIACVLQGPREAALGSED